MKKVILISILTLGMLQAADTNSTSRAETMQNMEKALTTIQKGFLYNDRAILEKGVKGVKKYAKDINAFDIKNEKGSSFHAKKYAETESKAISSLASDILKGYDRKSRNRVLDSYRKLQNQCIVCHQLVRKW